MKLLNPWTVNDYKEGLRLISDSSQSIPTGIEHRLTELGPQSSQTLWEVAWAEQ